MGTILLWGLFLCGLPQTLYLFSPNGNLPKRCLLVSELRLLLLLTVTLLLWVNVPSFR